MIIKIGTFLTGILIASLTALSLAVALWVIFLLILNLTDKKEHQA